jgi:hypothetical protein
MNNTRLDENSQEKRECNPRAPPLFSKATEKILQKTVKEIYAEIAKISSLMI